MKSCTIDLLIEGSIGITEKRITGHILFQLLFTKTREFICQCSSCIYFEIQIVTIMKLSKNIKFSFIEFFQTLSWYVKALL